MNDLQLAWWTAYQNHLAAYPNSPLSAKAHADEVVASLRRLA